MSNEAAAAGWIRPIKELNKIEKAQLKEGFPLLPIDGEFCFDLLAWVGAEPWRDNHIPPRPVKEIRQLAEELASRGMDEKPVIDVRDGWVADGSSRLRALHLAQGLDGLSIHFPGFITRRFETQKERDDYQAAKALTHRQLKTKQKTALVRVGITNHPEWADNRIGALYALDQATVTRVSDEMVEACEISSRPETRIGADGREHPAPKAKKKKKGGELVEHPALPLIMAWHRERGGHATTSEEIIDIADANGIDLVALGVTKNGKKNRARRLSATSWLLDHEGHQIGKFYVSARKAPNGWAVFSLLRPGEYRPSLKATGKEDES